MGTASPGSGARHPRHRFAAFALLCFGWLAALPALQWAFGIASLDFSAMTASATEKSGVPWTSSLVNVVRLALEEPGLWLLVLGSAAPTLAALSILLFAADRSQWSDFIGRLHPLGLRRQRGLDAIAVYATIVCSILACLILVFALRETIEPGRYAITLPIDLASLAASIGLGALLDQGAALEEPGWRGYATPLLQSAGLPPLATAVTVGIVWGLWHIPRDVATGVIERLGETQYVVQYLPAFLLGTIAVSIIATVAMNRLGGSIVPAIVVHGLTNDSIGIAGSVTLTQALTPYHQITKVVPLVALSLVLLAVFGGRTRT